MSVDPTGTVADAGIAHGSAAQEPLGSFPTFASLAAVNGTDVYQGGQRTAANPGSITAQSVRFDATYGLGTTGYDLSMGAGEVEARVVYAVYVP